MNRSLKALAAVLLGLISVSSMGWLYLHAKGNSKPIKVPFEHAFLKAHDGDRVLVLLRNGGEAAPITAAGLRASIGKLRLAQSKLRQATLGLWLDVRLVEDRAVIAASELLPNGKPIEAATRDEAIVQAQLPTLESLASELKEVPVVLNLIARKPGLAQALLKIWGEGKPLAFDSIVVQSESDGILKELRENEARGLFGSSQATLIQIEVLSSVGLASLLNLKSDVLISLQTETIRGGAPQLRLREATLIEAHRRGLKRYVGPVSSIDELHALIEKRYDGFIVDDWHVVNAMID